MQSAKGVNVAPEGIFNKPKPSYTFLTCTSWHLKDWFLQFSLLSTVPSRKHPMSYMYSKALFTLLKKLSRVNPGSTWVEVAHVDFCSGLPGFNPVRYAFTLQKSKWVTTTQAEPGFTLGNFFSSVNRATAPIT